MTKEQIEIIRRTINTMMMMAKAAKDAGCEDSMKSYANQGVNACKMLIKAEKEWKDDKTETINFPVEMVA